MLIQFQMIQSGAAVNKYLFLFLAIPAIAFSQAGVRTQYICDTCQFSTWIAWEAAGDDNGNLPSIDSAVIGIRRDDETTTDHGDVSSLRITGWTTDATRDISIEVPLNLDKYHGGIADTTDKFYLISTSTVRVMEFNEQYTNVSGFYMINLQDTDNNETLEIQPGAAETSRYIVKNCIIEYAGPGTSSAIVLDGFNNGMQLHLRNNLIFNGSTESIASGMRVLDLNCSLYVYNNTWYTESRGISWDVANDNNSQLTNNIFMNMDSVFVAQDAVDFSTYNGTDAENWGGEHTPGTGDDSNLVFLFRDQDRGNFLIHNEDIGAIDLGTDLGGATYGAFDDDINGNNRDDFGAAWDRGMSENIIDDDFPTGWGRRVEIVTQSSQVAENVTNFPEGLTEVNFPSEIFAGAGSNQALDGGGDIRFTSDEEGTTRIPIDLVSWDSTNSTCEVHVKYDFSSSSNTSVWCWYNKADVIFSPRQATYGSGNTWSQDYNRVYHLNDPPDFAKAINSTAADAIGAVSGMESGDLVAGQIGLAYDFDGTTDEFITVDDAADIDFDAVDFGFSAWIEPDNTTQSGPVMIGKGEDSDQKDYRMFIGGDDLHWDYEVGGGGEQRVTTADVLTTSWQFVYGRYTESTKMLVLFIDGVPTDSTAGSYSPASSAFDFFIGKSPSFGFDGSIDEAHIMDVARTDGWILTEYNNQNSPSTFAIEGTPETPGAPAAEPRFRRRRITGGH